jgi:hypothetical protein
MAFRIAFYRGTRPGIAGLYNRLGRWLDHGPYSHAELVFSDGMSGSASYMDHGVRIKYIGYTSGDWDFVEIPARFELVARNWFIGERGKKYDLMGNINAAFGFVPHSRDKWFCSEAIAAALGLNEAWRFKPNGLRAILKELK